MKNHIALGLALVLGACGSGADDKDSAARNAMTPAKPKPVSYDPAFRDIAGTWTSAPGTVGERRILRIDVASGGGYSIDVRVPGTPEQIMETGRGAARVDGGVVTASPSDGNTGAVLNALGAWRATLPRAGVMVLAGADGRKVELVYKAF